MELQPPSLSGCESPLVTGAWNRVTHLGRVEYSICFGEERTYRYWLGAKIQLPDGVEDEGTCLFIMLNPSDADEAKPDQTVKKCLGFAHRWGYGTVWLCNLYAMCGSEPATALSTLAPVGIDNDRHISAMASIVDKVVLAWGSTHLGPSERRDRACDVVRMLDDAGVSAKMYHLNSLADGQPRHPVRLEYAATCARFNTAAYLSRC